MRVPSGVPGGGFGDGFRGGGGAVFLWKVRGKGKGVGRVGGGVGTSQGTGKSMRKLCQNYILANNLLVFPEISCSVSVNCCCLPVVGNGPAYGFGETQYCFKHRLALTEFRGRTQ